jgi:hypothetical protein
MGVESFTGKNLGSIFTVADFRAWGIRPPHCIGIATQKFSVRSMLIFLITFGLDIFISMAVSPALTG